MLINGALQRERTSVKLNIPGLPPFKTERHVHRRAHATLFSQLAGASTASRERN